MSGDGRRTPRPCPWPLGCLWEALPDPALGARGPLHRCPPSACNMLTCPHPCTGETLVKARTLEPDCPIPIRCLSITTVCAWPSQPHYSTSQFLMCKTGSKTTSSKGCCEDSVCPPRFMCVKHLWEYLLQGGHCVCDSYYYCGFTSGL